MMPRKSIGFLAVSAVRRSSSAWTSITPASLGRSSASRTASRSTRSRARRSSTSTPILSSRLSSKGSIRPSPGSPTCAKCTRHPDARSRRGQPRRCRTSALSSTRLRGRVEAAPEGVVPGSQPPHRSIGQADRPGVGGVLSTGPSHRGPAELGLAARFPAVRAELRDAVR